MLPIYTLPTARSLGSAGGILQKLKLHAVRYTSEGAVYSCKWAREQIIYTAVNHSCDTSRCSALTNTRLLARKRPCLYKRRHQRLFLLSGYARPEHYTECSFARFLSLWLYSLYFLHFTSQTYFSFRHAQIPICR